MWIHRFKSKLTISWECLIGNFGMVNSSEVEKEFKDAFLTDILFRFGEFKRNYLSTYPLNTITGSVRQKVDTQDHECVKVLFRGQLPFWQCL